MALPERFCLNHTDVPAAANCVQCHKPICSACIVEAQGKPFCSESCATKYVAFYSRYKPDAPDRWKTLRLVLKLGVVAAVALVVLLVGRAFGFAWCAEALKAIGL